MSVVHLEPNLIVAVAAILLAAVLLLERALRRRGIPALRVAADWARPLLPVLLLIFGGRAFAYEPMRVPSGSMMPTLLTGDFILVNKHAYGLRNPVDNARWTVSGQPARGDVAVFRYPRDHSQRYVKRVVGLPGDLIEIRGGALVVNGQVLELHADGAFLDTGSRGPGVPRARLIESLGGREHAILHCTNGCTDGQRGRWRVPENHYFVMGDNRDNSADSRYWGFVSDAELVGRAEVVWFHFKPFGDDWGLRVARIGTQVR